MDRYSTLWGTDKTGTYNRLATSKGLSAFLTQTIGAADAMDAVKAAEKLVTGVEMLPGYENEKQAIKPLAVVYAPLYLEKKLGVRGMKGFCALGISGLEHRSTRVSNFSHTWFFDRADMLTAGAYNYLDLLMGTHLTSSAEVKLHREGDVLLDMERLPEKVQPNLNKKDLLAVFRTIEAVYQRKNVVLVLEEHARFNIRSRELLTQIYSLMQPMMATETGFATYQTTARILELSAETNVQIFVVPSGAELRELPENKFLILDLSNLARSEPTSMTKVLLNWANMDWKRRNKAMEHLFAKSGDYTNGDFFVSRSQEFFVQAQSLEKWKKDTSKHKTIASMADLQAEDKTASEWNLVPWAKEVFKEKYPKLLAESAEIHNARNLAVLYEYDGADKELKIRSDGSVNVAERNHAISQYRYGHELTGTNEQVLCRLIWEKADMRTGNGYRDELEKKDQQIADNENLHSEAMKDLETGYKKQLQDKEEECKAQLRDKDLEIERQKNAAIEQETKFKNEKAELEKSHNEALNAAKDEHERKLGETLRQHTEKINQIKREHQTELRNQQDAAEEIQKELQTQKDTAVRQANRLQRDVAVKESQITALESEKAQIQSDLDRARGEVNQLQKKLKEQSSEKDPANSILTPDENSGDGNTNLGPDGEAKGSRKEPRKIKIGSIDLTIPMIAITAAAAVVALVLGILLGFALGGSGGGKEEYGIQWSAGDTVGDAGAMGKVSLSHNEAEAGEIVTVTVAPAEGWKVDGITCKTGAKVTKTSDTQYTFVMPEQEEMVLVTFSVVEPVVETYEISYLVNGQKDSNSEIAVVTFDRTTAAAGETVTVTVVPCEGWQIDEINCQSKEALQKNGNNAYTFVMPAQKEVIWIRASQIPQTLPPFGEDGAINWENVKTEVSWIQVVETDPENIAQILGEKEIKAEGWEQAAILLNETWDPALSDTASPYILLLHREKKAEDQLDTAALELLNQGWLVVDNGEWCMIIPAEVSDGKTRAWPKTMRASLKVMDLLNEKNEGLAVFAYQMEDDRIVDLQAMMSAAGMMENWWVDLDTIYFDETSINGVCMKTGSQRTGVMALKLRDGTEAGVLDYGKVPDLCDDMVGVAKKNGHSAASANDYVLVVLNGATDSTDSE